MRPSRFLAFFVVAGLAVSGMALAQSSDPIAARKALMKDIDNAAKAGDDMVKGNVPYDPAKAAAVFKTFSDDITKFGGLFPAGSDTGDTRAAPAIWTDRDGFNAAVTYFASLATQKASATGSQSDFAAALSQVTGGCMTCHRNYRVRK